MIDFTINTVNGSLPNEIAMPHLSDLILTGNSLAGPVPTVWNTPKLKTLSLYLNYFNGSHPDVSSLKELEVLNLANNYFTGSFPSNYGYLSSLKELNIDHNDFKSLNKIPLRWLRMKNLEEFTAEMLLGKIPPSIGYRWPKVKNFQILYGNLTDGLPRSICNWKNMMYLRATHSPLGGHIYS